VVFFAIITVQLFAVCVCIGELFVVQIYRLFGVIFVTSSAIRYGVHRRRNSNGGPWLKMVTRASWIFWSRNTSGSAGTASLLTRCT